MLKIKEKKAIEEYKNILIKLFDDKLDSIILFGSKARGDDRKDSDIDLMIIRNDNPKNAYDRIWQKTIEHSGELTLKYGNIDISPRVEVKHFFNTVYSPFFEQVKKEGVILWSRRIKESL